MPEPYIDDVGAEDREKLEKLMDQNQSYLALS